MYKNVLFPLLYLMFPRLFKDIIGLNRSLSLSLSPLFLFIVHKADSTLSLFKSHFFYFSDSLPLYLLLFAFSLYLSLLPSKSILS